VTFAAVAAAATVALSPAAFLQAHQAETGAFAEPGGQASPALTAWAALALRAVGARPRRDPLPYLQAHDGDVTSVTDVEAMLLAEAALGAKPQQLVARIRAATRTSGEIGDALNATFWGIIALRQADEPIPPASPRYVLAHQARSGGWSWTAGGRPDSNDTAAAVEALRAAHVDGPPITRALRFLRRFENRDGGFGLERGGASDAQSTAWVLQAYAAAGVRAPARARPYLLRLRRRDGSFRYSRRYGFTPVWVTSEVLPALLRKPFPLVEP
jgi:hypothetical protein